MDNILCVGNFLYSELYSLIAKNFLLFSELKFFFKFLNDGTSVILQYGHER